MGCPEFSSFLFFDVFARGDVCFVIGLAFDLLPFLNQLGFFP